MAMLAVAGEPIRYRLTYAGGDRVTVEIRIPDSAPAPRTFLMPRAIPMGYGEQYYDRYIRDLNAVREEGPRWKLDGLRRIAYQVDIRAMERDIHAASDASKVRDAYAGLLGYSVFGFVEGRENDPIVLTISGPAGWRVFSTLAPDGGEPRAANFYELADSQIAMGPDLVVEKASGRIPLYLALYAEREVDRSRILRLASEAMEQVADYFGGAPFPRYTVHFEVLQPLSPEHRYGFSMEHLNSGTFYLSPEDIAEDGRTRYNLAHHFAHSWIPKRSYGTGYFPFRWELAPMLDSIWFAEGFGQYAAAAALFPDEARRQQLLTGRFRNWLRQAPAFLREMRLEELSYIGSTRYSEDFRVGRTLFSRGALMAAEMDELIRKETNGARSLRDALRHLVAWSAREKRAWRIAELPAIFRQATGVDTKPVLDKWLAGTPLKD